VNHGGVHGTQREGIDMERTCGERIELVGVGREGGIIWFTLLPSGIQGNCTIL
jgi:hypothetical protein